MTEAVLLKPQVDQNIHLAGESIKIIGNGLPVDAIRWELMRAPELWDKHTHRTADPSSPHHGLSDIWVRYGDEAVSDEPHASHWYPSADQIPIIKRLCLDVMHAVGGTALGGVLITRIPAYASVKPHTDERWHAREYAKFGVQIASAPGQKFCFEDASLETRPGDLFTFNNQRLHWVTNPTAHERITLIACIRMES